MIYSQCQGRQTNSCKISRHRIKNATCFSSRESDFFDCFNFFKILSQDKFFSSIGYCDEIPAAERGVVEQAWQVEKRAAIAKKRRNDDDNFILILLLSLLGLVAMWGGGGWGRGISSVSRAETGGGLMVFPV